MRPSHHSNPRRTSAPAHTRGGRGLRCYSLILAMCSGSPSGSFTACSSKGEAVPGVRHVSDRAAAQRPQRVESCIAVDAAGILRQSPRERLHPIHHRATIEKIMRGVKMLARQLKQKCPSVCPNPLSAMPLIPRCFACRITSCPEPSGRPMSLTSRSICSRSVSCSPSRS